MENTNPPVPDVTTIKVQAAMLSAALRGHARLEEELLFLILEPYIGAMGPLQVMRMEHDEIEQWLERIPFVQNLEEAKKLLLKVISVARNHFAKEEQVLYPLANQTLSTERMIALGSQWAHERGISQI